MQDYFYFSRTERIGILWFCSLLSLVFLIPELYGHYFAQPQKMDWTAIQLDTLPDFVPEAPREAEKPRDSLFAFNPNKVTQAELVRLGLAERTSRTLINFRNKGGRFYQKQDLLKVYGLDSAWFARAEPFIQLDQKKPYRKDKPQYPKTASKAKVWNKQPAPREVWINRASAKEWQALRGIGPVLSARILKFRQKLGGFHQIDQVGQTYGLPDSTFQAIKPLLRIEAKLEKLKLNYLDEAELAAHPYISWKEARVLVNYRMMHGPYRSEADLEPILGIQAERKASMLPYFDYFISRPSGDQ